MFIGHFAVGLAGKKFAPRAPLAALWGAALFADILWPILVAIGAEEVRIVPGNTAYSPLDLVNYPWSHSLLMLLIWGALFAAFYRHKPDGKRTGLVLGALVVSHWVLDWITHRPDMPLWPGGPKFGLGLWESIPGTMVVEIAMFAIGVFLYLQATRATDRTGTMGFWGLIILLLATFVFDALDPTPPPSVNALWISALVATAVLLVWAAWVEKHRTTTSAAEPTAK